MLNFIRSFFRRSIDSIVSDITRKVQHLEQVAEQHARDAIQHEVAISKSMELKAKAAAENLRAVNIASKLKSLIEG